ncbi:MAG: ABC transporter ATP-binding protein [Clostridium sp.]|nr:ABC transporter ATP-binding protein [Clostridium sp.]MCM1398543.1 ABC transporter ATP-binding protein [Clostridium sp.]MCM1459831.1 ABC transporter ATP-binding protein [Bacteroides sp.]
MEILKLEHVCYRYDNMENKVINDISYRFENGKLYCITGGSGVGKSTLISLIAGLDAPASGKILFEGKDITKINRDIYRSQKVSVIFQGCNLLQNATAAENISLSLHISGKHEKDNSQLVYDLLEHVGIDREKADRKILKLSGGEQQRVAIARAVACGASVLIADEPTGNLDSENEAKIMDIFLRIAHKDNKCVIVVTHSKEVAKRADAVMKMQGGE